MLIQLDTVASSVVTTFHCFDTFLTRFGRLNYGVLPLIIRSDRAAQRHAPKLASLLWYIIPFYFSFTLPHPTHAVANMCEKNADLRRGGLQARTHLLRLKRKLY